MKDIVVNGYVVNWQRAELNKDGNSKALEAKQLAVLQSLATAQGNIVSQEQLLDTVWAGTVVTPNTVQQTIAQLRRLLDDDGKSQTAIKTHPKLGYSLVFKEQEHSKVSTGKKAYQRLGLVFFLLASFVVAVKYMLYGPVNLKVEVNPVTVEGEKVKQFTYHKDSDTIYFVEQNIKGHRLVSLSSKQQKQTLIDGVKTYGSIAISPNGALLAFAVSNLEANNRKCIQLNVLELENLQLQQIASCESGFSHSPQWFDNERLIYQSTDVKNQSQLRSFDLSTNNDQVLKSQTNNVELFALNRSQLITLEQEQLQFYQLNDNGLTFRELLKVEQTPEGLIWLNDDEFALQYKKSVSIYKQGKLLKSFDIPGLSSIKDMIVKDDTSYLAVLQQNNWDVRERGFNPQQDKTIGKTQYTERHGKYRGEKYGVSYLSERTGKFQVWFDHKEGRKQLTFSSVGVTSHIWLNRGQLLLYIADGRLWKQSLGGKASELELTGTPINLFDAKDSGVLLSTRLAGTDQLVSFDVNSGKQKTIYQGKVDWAQKLNDDLYISNNALGKLALIDQGTMTLIDSLKDIKLQWRYFYKADKQQRSALYFQDKQKNIWRYELAEDKAQIIAQYDENALFMTDFSAINMTMLSDNFIAEQNDLVEVNLSR